MPLPEDLKAEIENDPAGLGYAEFITEAPGRIADMMNEPRFTMHKSRMVSFKGLYTSYGVGPDMAPVILGKIRAGAEASQVLFDVKEMIYSPEGIDFGDAATLEFIDRLTPAVFTTAEADALRAIALQPTSRAEVLYGAGIVLTETDVRKALNGNG